MLGGDDAGERGLDELARRRRDDEERKREAVQAVLEKVDQRRDVLPQPDPPARLDQVFPPNASELRVVPDQVRELAALLDEIARGEARDLVLEPGTPSNSLRICPESLKLSV